MKKELRDFGLSDNEVEVYLALLKTGLATANRVAEITGIKRSTTYDNLSLLINKGIVSKMEKDDVAYYEAAEPQKIIDLLDEKRTRIEKILPKLEGMRETVSEKTGVTFFEGKKGVLTVLNDIIDEGKELWFYGSRKKALISLRHYPENFLVKRAEHGIKLKAVLAEEDKGDPAYKDKKVKKLSSIKFSKAMNKISSNVFIYGNNVAIMTSSENPVGIIIRNKEVLQQQKQIFNMLWNST